MTIDKETLLTFLEHSAGFDIVLWEEDTPVRGNLLASGDDEQDRKAEDAVLAELESGNQWAWCRVEVIARYGEWTGSDFLGGCSYASEKDFCQPGGYYDDMKSEALEQLATEILASDQALEQLRKDIGRYGRCVHPLL